MSEEGALPPVPQALLAPLLQGAGEVLQGMKAQEVPPSLRPLLGFDRRGFGSAAARTQLRKALDGEAEFREQVLDDYAGRADTEALLGGWDPAKAASIAADAAERADLPALVSALVAARPDGWELGVGAAVAVHEQGMARQSADDDRRAFETQVRKAEEARRRAEEEAARWREQAERAAAELRDERASRREREEAAFEEAEAQREQVEALRSEIEGLRDEFERLAARATREAERTAQAEREGRDVRERLVEERDRAERALEEALADAERRGGGDAGGTGGVGGVGGGPAVGAEEAEILARAAEIADRIAGRGSGRDSGDAGARGGAAAGRPGSGDSGGPEGSGERAESGASAEPAESGESGESEKPADAGASGASGEAAESRPKLTRRVRVPVPPGMVGPSVEGMRGALGASEPAVIVDGYNVSMAAWPDAAVDTQRQRLCALLERLHLRSHAPVTVVFDGAEVEGVRPPRRPGVRVLFSSPGEEADDVVIREVGALPLERSAIVVSSDRRVQEASEAEGALAVPSQIFLDFLRRT